MNIKRNRYSYHLEGRIVNAEGQEGWEWIYREIDPYGSLVATSRVRIYKTDLDEAYQALVAYDDEKRERYQQNVRELLAYASKSSAELFGEFMADDGGEENHESPP